MLQKMFRKSHKSIVAMKQPNTCESKGLTEDRWIGNTTSTDRGGQRLLTRPNPLTYSSVSREVSLKSPVQENCTQGSVRGA